MIQMQWWDKLDATMNIIWLVFFGCALVWAVIEVYKQAGVYDECNEELDEYLEECKRNRENMEVERKGWKSINEELRKENEELRRKNTELMVERERISMQMNRLVQSYKVVTLDDLHTGIDAYLTRMQRYIDEQDQVLAAYTTGNFIVENTGNLQKRLDDVEQAKEYVFKAKGYILQAKTVCSNE